jgi:hypothetical protein
MDQNAHYKCPLCGLPLSKHRYQAVLKLKDFEKRKHDAEFVDHTKGLADEIANLRRKLNGAYKTNALAVNRAREDALKSRRGETEKL